MANGVLLPDYFIFAVSMHMAFRHNAMSKFRNSSSEGRAALNSALLCSARWAKAEHYNASKRHTLELWYMDAC